MKILITLSMLVFSLTAFGKSMAKVSQDPNHFQVRAYTVEVKPTARGLYKNCAYFSSKKEYVCKISYEVPNNVPLIATQNSLGTDAYKFKYRWGWFFKATVYIEVKAAKRGEVIFRVYKNAHKISQWRLAKAIANHFKNMKNKFEIKHFYIDNEVKDMI